MDTNLSNCSCVNYYWRMIINELNSVTVNTTSHIFSVLWDHLLEVFNLKGFICTVSERRGRPWQNQQTGDECD